MIARLTPVLVCTAMLSVAAPVAALACACCAEYGQRLETQEGIKDYARGEIARLRFGPTARIASSAIFPFDAKRSKASDLSDLDFNLSVKQNAGAFQFDLSNAAGQAGSLNFNASLMTRFEVDPRDDDASNPGRQPRLYKEWRLRGGAVGIGAFVLSEKVPVAPTQARLILHGRGNSCTSTENFTHWTLLVKGPVASFTLIGRLAAPAPSQSP